MSSDDYDPTDASTVHRAPEDLERMAAEQGSEPTPPSDPDLMSQANTVIRGSSRIEKARDRLGPRSGTPAAVAKVLLGQRLNHFLLNEMIGGGGMGAVFRAHDEHLDRTVAIKVIPFVGEDPDLQRRFRNEAQSAAKLDHPRIARVYDAGSHDDWHYIVFEYIEGTNIRDQVSAHGVMSIDEAVFYTSHLADALQHAADRGIVHRDIKPSNVLIGTGGKIKLVDMGLARSDNLDLSEDMTASGVTLGTFDYISPEQAHDPRVADLRSDIYSLGCTLYFMLTGRPPYPGGTMLQKLLSHGNAPPPDVREPRPDVSSNLAAVIQKMLAKKPEDRYQTATDLIADLREVAFRDGLSRSQTLSPVTISQPNPLLVWLERHVPWIAAVALMVASAGWLHLESATSRRDIEVPPSAKRPLTGVETEPANFQAERSLNVASDEVPIGTIPPLGLPTTNSAGTLGPSEDVVGPAMSAERFAAEDNVSIEPLSSEIPDTIRVVGPELGFGVERDEDGYAVASTLSRALEMASELGVSNIQIAVPFLSSEPVQVAIDDLKISSSVGTSVIAFQSEDAVSMERSKMFTVGSHPIELEGLHFHWRVPVGEVDGGALFAVNDGRIELTDCTLTIDNPTLREEVYAFEVVTNPDAIRSRDQEEMEDLVVDQFPRVSVDMKNVIVRGQVTMLHMDYAAELLLSWKNGLLAITDRMIETAGAFKSPPTSAGPIQITLTRVTAHAPKGIVQMRMGVSGKHPVAIDRFARNCVFFVSPNKPHFEFIDNVPLDLFPPLLQLRGISNSYVVNQTLADPMLIIEGMDDETEVTRMNDLLTTNLDWVNDNSPLWSVRWTAGRITDDPTSERDPADYRQPIDSVSGFDEKLLPSLPGLDILSGENIGVSQLQENARNTGEF